MSSGYIIGAIVMMAMATYATRLLPFLFFSHRQPPPFVIFLETYLPPVMMTILVFYSLKDIDFDTAPYGGYELAGVAGTVALHLLFKNYLVSIFGGTLMYMALVQGWVF
jgi:branched-subunit amino acid transport protein AzlD